MKTIINYLKSLLAMLIFFWPGILFSGQAPFSSSEIQTIQSYLFNNISSERHVLTKKTCGGMMSALPGAVIASPSTYSENFRMDYMLSWVRDSAIVMDEVIYLYQHANSAQEKNRLLPYLKNYLHWVEMTHQRQPIHSNIETLGEPIFNINGSIWNGQWSRPQYDGPALQAIALIHLQNALQELSQKQWSDEEKLQLKKLVEADLDFIALHVRDPSYSLWEEGLDQNFFTEMVQRKAFLLGAQYELKQNNEQKANYYRQQVKVLEGLLDKHWNAATGYYAEGLLQQDLKGGSINISVILGVLMGDTNDVYDPYAPDTDKMLSTAFFICTLFQNLYFINLHHPELAPMLGRYLNDKYDGNQFLYGNPWFIATNAMAQFYYNVAKAVDKKGTITITPYNIFFLKQVSPNLTLTVGSILTRANNPSQFAQLLQALIASGDALLRSGKIYAVCYKAGDCLHFSEQVDRLSGKQVGALDLTWSYVSVLTALQARPVQ